MGRINLYRRLNEDCEVIEANGKIKDILPEIDFSNCVILKAGDKISPDYEIKEEDILFLRVTPSATAVAIVGLVFAVISAGISIGAAVYANKVQQDAQEKLNKAQQEANELAQKTKQLPFLKGANNRKALGYSIPYVMGSIYHTPYLLTSGFYSIGGADGANQYWNAILVNGFKNQLIESVSIGNNSVLKGTQEAEADGKTIKYIPDGKHSVDESSLYYDSENEIEIITSGESSIKGLNQKVTSTSYGEEIKYDYGASAEPLIKQLEANTMKVDVCISFDGLRRYKEGWKSKLVNITVEWTNNASADNPTWNSLASFSINRNTNQTIRFEKSYAFTAAQAYGKDISIRLTRTNPCEESNSNEACYLLYINSWAYDNKKSSSTELVACAPLENPWRDRTSRIAVKMISNDSTKDALDSINIVTFGKARIWDSESESWSEDKAPTRNPAAWIYEILTSDSHVHSKYSDEEINTDSLGALYEYCQENKFYCDGIIDSSTKKKDIISSILSECNSTMFINSEGLLDFAIDKKESIPVALLNAQSIKSVTVAKNFERKAEGKKLTFTNRDSWAVDNAYITLEGDVDAEEIYDSQKVITEKALKYVTTYNHAYKLAYRELAQQQLQPRDITVNVGQEGDYYPLYSLVMLQMKELLQGLSNGVIKGFITSAGKIIGLNLSDYVDLSDNTKRYGIIIQACSTQGKEHLYIECNGSGYTNKVYFNSELDYIIKPEVGNIYSIGELDSNGEFSTVTNKMKIYGIKPSSDGWELTLKDYNEAIYTVGDIPEYKTNLTLPKATASQLRAPTFGDINSIAGEYAEATRSEVSKLFNSQLVQIYKESDSLLTDEDLPTSALVYNFETKSYSWASPDSGYPDKSNGWSWSYPTEATNTVYSSYATAQSQQKTASVASEDWSYPIPSGNDGTNGMNNFSITLYTREDEAPSYLPSEITYDFRSGEITGLLNGWKLSIPSAVNSSSPCWEIHALAISETYTATIDPVKWSEPVRISTDGITEGEVREIIKEELTDVAESPNVYADFSAAGFAVNSQKRTLKAQEVKVTVKVIQTNEELDFTFDTERLSALLPSGWSFSIDYHTITIKVNAGVKVVSGSFVIPIIYKSYKYRNTLGYIIGNETYTLGFGDTELGYASYYPEESTYDLGFTYQGIEGGIYLGKINSLSNLPEESIIGDFFTWSGENTASSLSQEGSFKLGGVYFYSGDSNSWRWEKDEDITHIAGTMSDILDVANSDLQLNNSKAYEYLNHLTANTIFTDLLTANNAFISKLVSNEAIIQGTGTNNYLKKAIEDSSDELVSALSASEDKTVIEGGYLKTSLINTNALEILDSSGNVKTLITEGKISSGLVTADSIEAGAVTTEKIRFDKTLYIGEKLSITNDGTLTTKSGVFNNCNAEKLNVSEGNFSKINVIDSEFNGVLNCGSLQIKQETINKIIKTYTKNGRIDISRDEFNYLDNLFGTDSTYLVTQLFNNMTICIGDNENYYKYLRYHYAGSRSILAYEIYGIKENGEENLLLYFQGDYSGNYQYYIAYEDVVIKEYKAEALILYFNDLPTKDPSNFGQVWNDNGVLKVSQ